MLIVMKSSATREDIDRALRLVESLGFKGHSIPGSQRTAIGITGNQGTIDSSHFEDLPGIAECIQVSKPYKLVSREVKRENTVVDVGGVPVGGPGIAIVAGPCAIENEDQAMQIAEILSRNGIKLFRGGAFKPRTSPYSFQGLGRPALEILAQVRERFGMRIVTEAIDASNLDVVAEYADMVQIGARNMQNYSLLKHAGHCSKPILLKRGLSANLEEFLMSAEYIMSEGNYQVVLCERGVRTFADHSRNTLDLSVVPAVKSISHLPIIVDPSHGTGRRDKVCPLARAAVAVGADGLMVEVHNQPEKALSDGFQSLYPDQFLSMIPELKEIAHAVKREI